jgi:amidophosphoribosyltransferase
MFDKCGVLGFYISGREVSRLAFLGLHALQHRGHESAGITTSDGEAACLYT